MTQAGDELIPNPLMYLVATWKICESANLNDILHRLVPPSDAYPNKFLGAESSSNRWL